MYLLIFCIVYITFLMYIVITLLIKNHNLEEDNLKLSIQTNNLLRENSKLRRELVKDVLY